jgi:hypothetical protein
MKEMERWGEREGDNREIERVGSKKIEKGRRPVTLPLFPNALFPYPPIVQSL